MHLLKNNFKINKQEFSNEFISKIFVNQDYVSNNYKEYILYVDCEKYNFISLTDLNLSKENLNFIINNTYDIFKDYYYKLCN